MNVVKKTQEVVSNNKASYSDIQTLAEELILEGYDIQQLLLQV